MVRQAHHERFYIHQERRGTSLVYEADSLTELPLVAVVTGTMIRFIAVAFFLLFTLQPRAEVPQVLSVVSSANRAALLELYTSEGCSSCPPADRFMSQLKNSDISDQQLIPLSFHVTYWDYIGWRDRFANDQYDDRQRKQAMLNAGRSVYTPQFMLNGKDYRHYRSLDTDVQRINTQAAAYQLKLTAIPQTDSISVKLNIRRLLDNHEKAIAYLALYEHNLTSAVTDGENEGERLHHDYVVRELKGPYSLEQDQAEVKAAFAHRDYKIEDSGVVAFIQKPLSSEVLQAVRLELMQ